MHLKEGVGSWLIHVRLIKINRVIANFSQQGNQYIFNLYGEYHGKKYIDKSATENNG